jgi:hypothetical protein
MNAQSVDSLIEGYVDKVLNTVGVDTGNGWRSEELE